MSQCSHTEHTVECAVRSHKNTVQVCILCNPLEFFDTAYVSRIGSYDIHCPGFNKIHKVLTQEYLLSGMYGGRGTGGDIPVHRSHGIWRIVAGDGIFKPHNIIWLKCLCQANHVPGHKSRTNVKCQTNLVSHNLFQPLYKIDAGFQTFFGEQAALGNRLIQLGAEGFVLVHHLKIFRVAAPAVPLTLTLGIVGIIGIAFTIEVPHMPEGRNLNNGKAFRYLV